MYPNSTEAAASKLSSLLNTAIEETHNTHLKIQ